MDRRAISYTTDGVGDVLQAELSVNLQRSRVPAFCKAARIKVQQLLGASFYYPDVKSGRNVCRYEWLSSRGRKKYVWRYGFMFTVSTGDIERITAYVGYGDSHPDFGTVPNFTPEDVASHFQKIIEIVEDIDREASSPEETVFHVLTYVEMPHGSYVTTPLQFGRLGLTVLPTVLAGKENKQVSAFIFSITAPNLESAKAIAFRTNLWICSLLTLATESVFNIFYVQWGKKRQPVVSIDSLSPLPSNAALYPPRSWRAFEPSPDSEFLQRLGTLLAYYESLEDKLKSSIRNAIYAYRAGRDLSHKHPTLASVAFVAALSIFAKRQRCNGQLACSLHGNLESLKHELEGERQSIFNALLELHGIDRENGFYSELEGLLQRMYSKQRSAFVHGAILRHNEASEQEFLTVEPAKELPFAEELLYSNDLISIDSLCRRSILTFLAKSAHEELNVSLFRFDCFKVYRQRLSSAHVSLPKKTWVGFRHLTRSEHHEDSRLP